MEDENNYNAVPPPASLTSNNAPVNFNDALSKARAIAEKLKQQSAAAAPSDSAYLSSSAGSKRGYREDSEERDDYRSQSSRGYEERDYKRSAYESSGSSRPTYSTGSDARRYGLGSEERSNMSSYGSSSTGPQVQEEITVPNHMVGLIIGRGGDNLKKIERMSGAKVQFLSDTGDSERRVNLVGDRDELKIARDMIQQVVDDTMAGETGRRGGPGETFGGSGPTVSAAMSGNSLMIHIPANKVGLVIGRGGETIRDLEERSGAKIMISPEGSAPSSGERSVNIIGSQDAIQRAKTLIEDITKDDGYGVQVTHSRDWAAYREQHYNSNADNSKAAHGEGRKIAAPESSGASGASAASSASGYSAPPFATGANASSYDRSGPPSGAHSASYDRSGPPSGAYDRPYGGGGGGGYRGRYNNDDMETIQVPREAVGFIIGKGGETVRGLQDQSGARIKVNQNSSDHNSSERTISIFGSPDRIALAKQLILEKVEAGSANRGSGRYGGEGYGRGGYGSRGGGYGGGRYSHGSSYHQDNADPAAYDYSQYQQYYAQYGYDQYAQADPNAAAQGYEGYQYAGYPYAYGGYPSAAPSAENAEANAGDASGAVASADKETSSSEAAPAEGAPKDDQNAAYYAQYYGNQGDQQWTQEAYNQWYQQYYGGQYGNYDQQQQAASEDKENAAEVPPSSEPTTSASNEASAEAPSAPQNEAQE
ncbi:uncharacterized protein BYT42DRAFT_564535 [Radiomyces spectabilis]|uniref:uncharacterized protein n=1 Tax=Radiomyces spectabilis TaxID=64574 RepID=UPI0022201C2F|nr:uncharacterized protein BYT42DRAFT_564535 [Radiomyces spectabilis]KAI8385060.1 hypothetical protein BYT42DRAFT_564535 [Radiomyces spectabilis]